MLLDWEKAFDKVLHDKLIDGLRQFGISHKMCKHILNFYNKANFHVKDKFSTSNKFKQSCGSRKGCPPSPYLFIILMSVINQKIEGAISNSVKVNRIANLKYDSVFYADDTIFFSRCNGSITELLHLTEHFSKEFGLMLNKNNASTLGRTMIKTSTL